MKCVPSPLSLKEYKVLRRLELFSIKSASIGIQYTMIGNNQKPLCNFTYALHNKASNATPYILNLKSRSIIGSIPLSRRLDHIVPLTRIVDKSYRYSKGDINMRRNTIEDQLLDRIGLKGMIREAEETAVSFMGKRIKSKFGIEMNITNQMEIQTVTEWIEKYDPKFNSHIQNPYVLCDMKSDTPILDSAFIIHIAKATYVYVNATSNKYNHHTEENNTNHYNPLYVYIFGRKCYTVFNSLSKYIKNAIKTDEILYSITGTNDNGKSLWKCTASTLTPRSMDTIFIDKNQKERIIKHLDKWCSDKETYINRGLLYKTGILLHGCPGCGKSSMAMAIANYLGCGLVTIDTTTFQYMNISSIVDSMVADECRYVVLIDEIDLKSREDDSITDVQEDKISKLLQFLDSPQSPTNVVFVATTNHYDRLDPALIRPGRFDLVEEMGDISKDIARDMCRSFDLNEKDIDTVLNTFDDKNKINPSLLQNQILNFIKTSGVNIDEQVSEDSE